MGPARLEAGSGPWNYDGLLQTRIAKSWIPLGLLLIYGFDGLQYGNSIVIDGLVSLELVASNKD